MLSALINVKEIETVAINVENYALNVKMGK
jgi:hypothetical protein